MTQRRHPGTRRIRRRGGFRPPHCPNPQCPCHLDPENWRYIKNGHHRRASDGRRLQAYRCSHCGREFSARTFSPSYWLRSRDLLQPILAWAVEGPGLRQIARHFGVSHSTVARHIARGARHCLLFHRRQLDREPALELREPVVIDGFESFAYSQYLPLPHPPRRRWPQHLPLRLHRRPAAPQGLDDPLPEAPPRRSSRTSRAGPIPKAVERGFAELVEELLPRLPEGEALELHSDDHPAYQRALRRIRRPAKEPRHPASRSPRSSRRRTTSNPLFPVNLADLRIRHGQANHRRETIAFSKHRQAAIERMALFMVWSNCIKRRSENHDETTAAMAVGVLKRRLSWKEILKRRLFPGRLKLGERWQSYYERRVPSPIYGPRLARHACAYAF